MIALSTSMIVFVLFVVPALGFALYLWLSDALVRIDAGEVGLVEVWGRPTDRVLSPGTHLVVPLGRMTMRPYPTRELFAGPTPPSSRRSRRRTAPPTPDRMPRPTS